MSVASKDLLKTAKSLLTAQPLTHSHICRSISTSYYAVFQHTLCGIADIFLGKPSVDNIPKAREHLQRAITHGDLKKRCAEAPGIAAFPNEAQTFSVAFIDLQEARHDADYKINNDHDRASAEGFLARAKQAMADFDSLKSDDRKAFVVWLTFKKPNW